MAGDLGHDQGRPTAGHLNSTDRPMTIISTSKENHRGTQA
jgi:hypothetical protein